MLHRWKSIVPLPLLLALTDCSAPARMSSHLTRVPGVGDAIGPASAPATARKASDNASDRPLAKTARQELAAHDDPPPVPAQPAIDLTPVPDRAVDWIPLETWSNANHLSPARWLSSAGSIGCELRTPGGVITVMAGNQIAHWDGVSCWLGFAPHLANGRLLVHALDARYNLLPLASRQSLPANGDRVVVIDPGHGGENMGTRSVTDNRLEKEFTLDWALRLGPLLACEGWTVVLTRTNDVDVSLSDRVALADRINADLFVSLHFNSSAHRDQAGLETYCLTPTGMPSTLTRDYEDDTTRVYPNNAFDNQNLQYAVRIHRSLAEASGLADRGVRRARFMAVLRGQNRPAVLVEGGYLSSPREAQAIADPKFRQKLAEAVATALSLPNMTGQASITDAIDPSH